MNKMYLKTLLTSLFIAGFTLIAKAQDINVGSGSHDQIGYGPRINFIGNSDNCFITQYNVTSNITEFRFNISDDLFDDKFVIGVTNSGDGLWYPKMTVQSDGKVGIGTANPTVSLDVIGDINGSLIKANTLFSLQTSGKRWDINYEPNGSYFFFDEFGQFRHMVIQSTSGNVGIGTLTPDAKLAVKGSIHSQVVKVDMNGWADYVFKPTYKLPSLSEVKTYIDQNQHLPEMPSADEVEKNGVNLGEMVKLQTKKIEELTLYLIEQNKQLLAQQKLIEALIKKDK